MFLSFSKKVLSLPAASRWELRLLFLLLFTPVFVGVVIAGDHVWKASDGTPLPFQSPEEIEEFLRTADVEEVERAPEGTTAPQKILLEKDGVKAYAIFRSVSIDQKQTRLASGTVVFDFRDDAVFEKAAYELARLLGYQNIPPTVQRKIRGKDGTVQIWVTDSMMEKTRLEEEVKPPNKWRWAMQVYAMRLWDKLIYNDDRNVGNVLIDSDWNIWMIDHTRTFRKYSQVPEIEQIKFVERGVWEKLNNLKDEEIRSCLEPYVSADEIKALLKRRTAIVKYLSERIKAKGEKQVLFSLWTTSS